MLSSYKPINNLVIVDPVNELDELQSKSKIVLPEHDNVLPWRGKVIGAGPECKYVKKGMMVIFDRMRSDLGLKDTGRKFKLEDKDVLIIPETLIFATIG